MGQFAMWLIWSYIKRNSRLARAGVMVNMKQRNSNAHRHTILGSVAAGKRVDACSTVDLRVTQLNLGTVRTFTQAA